MLMETTTLSIILNIIFGSTTVVGIVKWIAEKNMRKIAQREKETSVGVQQFDALTKQIEYQKQLIDQYIENESKRDEIDDKQRTLINNLKRNQYKIESDKIELQQQLALAKYNECLAENCPNRKKLL